MKVMVRKVSHNGAGCWYVSNGRVSNYFAYWVAAFSCAIGLMSPDDAHEWDLKLARHDRDFEMSWIGK